MQRKHIYRVGVTWTGDRGVGTQNYSAYSRDHLIEVPGKPVLPGSSDPLFRGDPTRYNPEELLVASLSSCHMLWYLHFCADAGITVVSYADDAMGEMEETGTGGSFRSVTLRPQVMIRIDGDSAEAQRLHEMAHASCFIASSVNFPVLCEPRISSVGKQVR